MVPVDVFIDVCFLLLSIAATVFVIVMRKRFDMWISLPICAAWVLKSVRYLYYDWVIVAVSNVKEDDIFLFMQKAHLTLEAIDVLVNFLLYAALMRLVIVGLYLRWYKKAIKSLEK